MNHKTAVRFSAAAICCAFSAVALAQSSPVAPDGFDALRGRMRAVAVSATQESRARARDARLAALLEGAPPTTADAAAGAWVMAEPGRGGALTLDAAAARVGYREFNGLSAQASAPLTIAAGEVRFVFTAGASSRSSGDMDDREIPTVTTGADYRCRVLADKDLMVCRVSFVAAHDLGAPAAREERYEGFERESFTPFR